MMLLTGNAEQATGLIGAAAWWPDGEHLLWIACSIAFGGLIGLDREFRDKPAGFRTIILICLGACVFSILSQVIGGPDGESTRIAAQIVSGIGFLGAGAIIQNRQSIVGLTTAATIWAVAAVGAACGFGRLGLAFVGTAAILLALFVFDSIERFIGARRDLQDYVVVTDNTEGAFERFLDQVRAAHLHPRKRTCHEEDGRMVIRLVALGAKTDHERFRLKLMASDEYTVRPA